MAKLTLLVLLGVITAVTLAETVAGPPQPPFTPTSSKPTDPPTKPTDPTKPPTKPTDPTKPTTKPTDPTIPTTKPTEPTKPTTKPTEPTKPTTKPTEPTKPTPKPTNPPKPVDPVTGNWSIDYPNTNKSCLLVQFAVRIEVPYNTTDNKTSIAAVDIPKDATASGSCNEKTQSLVLQWNSDVNVTDSLILNFALNETAKKYVLHDIDVSLTPDNKSFPSANDLSKLSLNHKQAEFSTSIAKSYRCDKKEPLNLTTGDVQRGVIYISHLQFQAFANSTNHQFSSAEDCNPFDTPDVVPIAVGCALAALVIIVLIAYLIGRRRRQARGYLSMFTETKQESDYIPMKNLSCFN